MPFIRPPRPRRAPPRPAPQREASPFHVSRPEWDSEGELPNLREKDTIPLPWGGTIEHTLNKSAHPLDCEAWPGSPYCDIASTFDWGTIAGVGIDISASPCGVVVRATPTLFWLTMAPATVVYRRDSPECQPEVPVPAPPSVSQSFGFQPVKRGSWGCMYRAVIKITTPLGSMTKDQFPYEQETGGPTPIVFWGPLEGFESRYRNTSYPVLKWSIGTYIWAHGNAAFYPRFYGDPYRPSSNPSFLPANLGSSELAGTLRIELMEPTIELISFELIREGMPGWETWTDPQKWAKAEFNRQNCEKWKQLPPPPLPYLPDENMCNCKAIEADLKAIKQFLGVSSGGWSVPTKIRGLNTDQTNISNMAEMWGYFLTQFSEMIGDTSIKIKVVDTDLVADGNQEKELTFDNLAQAVTELLGLALSNASTQGAIYKTATQGLLQAGQATIAASRTALNLDEVIDFLAYGTQDEEEEIELFFTPGEDKPEDFLDLSTQKIIYRAFKDKQTFQTFAQKLLWMASVYQALNTINPDSEDFPKVEDAMRKMAKSTDIDNFIRDAEQGFQSAAGNPEITRPYGDEYKKRPRIKKWKGDGTDDGGP